MMALLKALAPTLFLLGIFVVVVLLIKFVLHRIFNQV